MLTPYSFVVSVLHSLPFSNSILFALFIFFFADWRKDHAVRALLLLFSIHPLLFFLWLNYEMVSVEAPLPILDFFTMSHMILMVPVSIIMCMLLLQGIVCGGKDGLFSTCL